MPMFLGTQKLKGGNGLVRIYVGASKVYDAYTYVDRTVTESIPYTSSTTSSSSYIKYKTVVTGGTNGSKRVVYRDTYKYGVLQSTTKISETTVSNPVNKVTTNGTATTLIPYGNTDGVAGTTIGGDKATINYVAGNYLKITVPSAWVGKTIECWRYNTQGWTFTPTAVTTTFTESIGSLSHYAQKLVVR